MRIFREKPISDPGSYKFLIKKNIYDNHDRSKVYLTRYILFRFKHFGVFVHKIWIPDNDRHLHDHPWERFDAFILKGGYTEECNHEPRFPAMTRRRTHGFLSHNKIDKRSAHSIKSLKNDKPVWTIVFPRKNVKTWGFYVPDQNQPGRNKFIDWKDYDYNNPDKYDRITRSW